jgi:hypothetical protein
MFATLTLKTPVAEIEPFRTQWENEQHEDVLRRELAAKLAGSESSDATAASDAQDTLQPLVELQQVCPVTGLELGAMGAPLPVAILDRLVLLCCASCKDDVLARPDYYLARLRTVTEEGVLAVPEHSVIDTGTQKVVYVERKPGVFEGVPVTLGPRAGGYYAVIDGLLAGDRVAAAGAFLIDAETRLNPATSGTYFGASGAEHKH